MGGKRAKSLRLKERNLDATRQNDGECSVDCLVGLALTSGCGMAYCP